MKRQIVAQVVADVEAGVMVACAAHAGRRRFDKAGAENEVKRRQFAGTPGHRPVRPNVSSVFSLESA